MIHVAHLTAHSYIGIGSHSAIYPPAIPPVISPHVAMDTLLGLTIGAVYSPTVIGPFGFQFIGQGNDSGMVVPHIAIPPPSVLIPVVIAFGSSKPMFSASTVQIATNQGGKPVAADPIPYNFVAINQACNDPCNYPSDIVISPNSVFVGLTLGDFIGGLINVVIDVALSALINWGAGKASGFLMRAIGGRIAAAFMRTFAREMSERFGREMGERMTREAAENILEGRWWGQIIEGTLGKLLENAGGWVVGKGVEFAGVPGGDIGSAAGAATDAPGTPPASTGGSGSSTSPSRAGRPLANDHPGAPPIHSAD